MFQKLSVTLILLLGRMSYEVLLLTLRILCSMYYYLSPKTNKTPLYYDFDGIFWFWLVLYALFCTGTEVHNQLKYSRYVCVSPHCSGRATPEPVRITEGATKIIEKSTVHCSHVSRHCRQSIS